MRLKPLIRQDNLLKDTLCLILDFAFWAIVFVILLVNFHAAGSIFAYSENHDHHLAFFSYLGGMAANGNFPGIDFYSPHSIFIPLIFGLGFKILPISQVNLGVIDGIAIFITLIIIYKTARFTLPSPFAKLAVLTLLLSHSGRDNPWFNDIIMLFVALGVYFFAAYINDKKPYRLYVIGFICFLLPYMRQQGLVISFVFMAIPLIFYYLKSIDLSEYKMMTKKILLSFVACNAAFFAFVFLRGGFEGVEIVISSLTSLVDMAQPAIGYDNNFAKILSDLFDYTGQGMDWHGYSVKCLSYWFIVIAPCLYFLFRPVRLATTTNHADLAESSDFIDSIDSIDSTNRKIQDSDKIRFVAALITLSTIIFNFPINEDARLRVQFGIGIWLFIDALYLGFYNKKIKIISLIAVFSVFLIFNHSKIAEFANKSVDNFREITTTRDGYVKFGDSTPYSGMRFKEEYANHLNTLVSSLQAYSEENPQKEIIFDGELVDINAYLFLLFSAPKVALQHKFPYRYGSFDRESFFSDIGAKYDEFIAKNKPIILGCKMEYRDSWIPDDYRILNKINENCSILVPQNSADSATQSAESTDSNSKSTKER